MSTPEPGPSGITNLTGCCGQVCPRAGVCAAVDTSAAKPQRIKVSIERRGLRMDFPCENLVGEYVNRCGRLLSSRTAWPSCSCTEPWHACKFARRVFQWAGTWAVCLHLSGAVSYTHLRAHETGRNLVCRL